ncbi:MAG: hypothetical protein IH621_02345 [Krumholzibacteria bacterium]|nr:hypothetical protein [Candidatus Krumholzibacteria bacterium]
MPADSVHARGQPAGPGVYRPRRPERTVLRRVVREHLESHLASAGHDDDLVPVVPRHVEAAFREYLKCGILLVVGTILINLFALRALTAGRTSREKLLRGLNRMYTDNDVAKYYDDDLLGTYRSRYTLFSLMLVVLAVIAIAVPLVARGMN